MADTQPTGHPPTGTVESTYNDEQAHAPHLQPNTLVPPEDKSHTPSSLSDSGSGDVEKAPEPVEPEASPRDVHGLKWGLAVFSVLVSTFLFALDNTIVADIQPAIVERFGQVEKISWLAVAFLIAAIGTNLFW